MTHDEVRRLIPRYAAGELETTDADAVRAHLTGGCMLCLHDVFERPVGLPRPRPGITAEPPAVPPPRRIPLVVTGLALTAGGIALLTWAFGHSVGEGEPAARVAALLATQDELATRLQHLDDALARAQDDVSRETEAARTARATSAELERALEAAQSQLLALDRTALRPEGQVDRLLASVDARRALAELTGVAGLRLTPLEPVAPNSDARGHVLWHPGRRDVVVSAFHLPALREGELYRIRLRLADGETDEGTAFRPAASGGIVLSVPLSHEAAALRAVEVVHGTDDARVLAAVMSTSN